MVPLYNIFEITVYYLHILQSEKSGKFYIGYSSDPWRRIGEHNSDDRNTYASKFRHWHLKAIFQIGADENEAIRLEPF